MKEQEADSARREGYANGQRARRIADVLGTKTWPVYVQSDAWAEPVQNVLDAYEQGFHAGYGAKPRAY